MHSNHLQQWLFSTEIRTKQQYQRRTQTSQQWRNSSNELTRYWIFFLNWNLLVSEKSSFKDFNFLIKMHENIPHWNLNPQLQFATLFDISTSSTDLAVKNMQILKMKKRENLGGCTTLMNVAISIVHIFICRVEIFIFLAHTLAFCWILATKNRNKYFASVSATDLKRLVKVMKVSIAPTKRNNGFVQPVRIWVSWTFIGRKLEAI